MHVAGIVKRVADRDPVVVLTFYGPTVAADAAVRIAGTAAVEVEGGALGSGSRAADYRRWRLIGRGLITHVDRQLIRCGIALPIIDHQLHGDVTHIVEGMTDLHPVVIRPFDAPVVSQRVIIRIERTTAIEVEGRPHCGRGRTADHRGGCAIG